MYEPQQASPLLLYADQTSGLHFGRVDLDGAPYKGAISHLRDEEFERKTAHVSQAHIRMFDLENPEDVAAYEDVLSKIMNGLYVCHYHKPMPEHEKGPRAYVEWADVTVQQLIQN